MNHHLSNEAEPRAILNPAVSPPPPPASTSATPANNTQLDVLAKRQERRAARSEIIKTKFARIETDIAEELLEGFVADEIELVFALQEAERDAAGMLAQVMDAPDTAITVARLLREIVAVHSAIRGRAERSLQCAANLRAQRQFLRGRNGF